MCMRPRFVFVACTQTIPDDTSHEAITTCLQGFKRREHERLPPGKPHPEQQHIHVIPKKSAQSSDVRTHQQHFKDPNEPEASGSTVDSSVPPQHEAGNMSERSLNSPPMVPVLSVVPHYTDYRLIRLFTCGCSGDPPASDCISGSFIDTRYRCAEGRGYSSLSSLPSLWDHPHE